MNLFNNFFLLASLASLSFIACADDYECADEQCELDSKADDDGSPDNTRPELVRVEIEVVGDGDVFIEEPVSLRCSSDRGLCSFSYLRGTELVLHADGEFSDAHGWQDACEGFDSCKISLDYDQVVVANFKPSGAPTDPQIIVDPFPGVPERDLHQELRSDTFRMQ